MGRSKRDMFGTMNLREAPVVGDLSALPHSQGVQLRVEKLREEREGFRERAGRQCGRCVLWPSFMDFVFY